MKLEIDRLLFTLRGEFFCIDIHAVSRIIEDGRILRLPLAPPSISGIINLKGELIPVINPTYILNTHYSIEPIKRAYTLIVGKIPRFIGFPLPEQEEVFFVWNDKLSDIPLKKVEDRYIKGITTWKDNKVKILDWEQILQSIYE